MGFPATLCVSIEEAVVHGITKQDILKEGQIVGIDSGAELDGYYGDPARSFAVGKINADKEKLLKVTKESLLRGIEQAVPGNFVGDIGICRNRRPYCLNSRMIIGSISKILKNMISI